MSRLTATYRAALLTLSCAAVWVCAIGRSALAADYVELLGNYQALDAAYRQQFEELAAWCDEHSLAQRGQELRRWLPQSAPLVQHLYLLPSQLTAAAEVEGDAAVSAADIERQFQAQFTELRRTQAAALFALAHEAAEAGHASLAWQLAVQTVREDPDHAEARRVLGYQQSRGRWLTPYEAAKARTTQVWHQRFGWLPSAWVPRYEAGERYASGHWITADQEGKHRGNISSGWEIATEHYELTTNHSLEEGVRLASRLEALHQVWQQLFAGYVMSAEEMRRLFDGGRPSAAIPNRMKVIYYRNQQEYQDALARLEPNIGITVGMYLGGRRTAYFFAGEQQSDGVLFHEATHQLFNESRSTAPAIGREANYWVLEGVACYLESLRWQDDYAVLGGAESERMYAARYRLLNDGFHVPLAELTGYGMRRLQTDERIATLYSQASGLTYFLQFYDGGRYRPALGEYLLSVYTGRDRPGTLSELTGKPYDALDQEYRDWIVSLGGGRQAEGE